MVSSISVAELRDEKRSLEQQLTAYIDDAVRDFYQATGVSVESINVHLIQHSTMEGHRWIVGNVTAEVNV